MSTSVWERIAKADVAEKSQRIPEGVHIFEVVRALFRKSKKNNDVNWIFELCTVESSNPELTKGTVCAYIQKESYTGWEGRVKAVVQAIAGGPVTVEELSEAFSEANPLMGHKVKAVGSPTAKTAKDGSAIINVTFYAV